MCLTILLIIFLNVHLVLGELKQLTIRKIMEVSPYLSAIQWVNGQSPGEKYKELHSISTQIMNNESEKNEFINTGKLKRVPSALLPYLRILVGNKLQQNHAVIEALKSGDATIIKQALRAKWFFNTSNALIRVDYFVKNIMPYVSLRTRLELIKTLASCLVNEPTKADEFFGSFADFYGLKKALPLIVACSEDYIFDAILKRRINLPFRLLAILYRRYPNLVVRYLQLGNDSNETNKADRQQHTISLVDYGAFLPVLVKNHTHVYVELHQKSTCDKKRSPNLGSTRAKFFLKNAVDVLIQQPKVFLELLPLKLVTNKLSTQQFEAMYENLFPDNAREVMLDTMLDYLKYYPEEKKLNLIKEKYRNNYNKELLEIQNITINLLKLLPAEEMEKIGRKMIEPYLNTPDYYDHLYYLPPKEAIPLLKEQISKTSSKREEYFGAMIRSCAIYNSMDDLHDLLCYYNVRHKNEKTHVNRAIFSELIHLFDLKTLPCIHWIVLMRILQHTYVRDHLSIGTGHVYKNLFENALHFYLKHCKTNIADEDSRNFLEKLIDIVLECCLEYDMKWEFINVGAELEHDCLQKFLEVLPEKYFVTHSAWENFENKLYLVSYIVQSIHNFNVKNKYMVQSKNRYSMVSTVATDSEGNEVSYTKFSIKSYDWLVKLVIDVLKSRCEATKKINRTKYSEFRRILQKHDAEFYQSLVDNDPDLLYDCETSDAVVILKRNSDKILSKWELYVKECKTLLYGRSKSPKRFITAMKWHQVIPIKFVEQCLKHIEDKGSILILAILLESNVFTDIAHSFVSRLTLDLQSEAAKQMYDNLTTSLIKAMNCMNPPNVLEFCDYVPFLASKMLRNIRQRVPVNRILEFAGKLIDNKTIAVKKLGIRLMFQVTTITEFRMFFTKLWGTEKNKLIRKMLVQIIFEIIYSFLTDYDITPLIDDKNKIICIDKNCVADCIVELLKKLKKMPEDRMDIKLKKKFVTEVSCCIDESVVHQLPEEVLVDITKRVVFGKNTNFVIKYYILSEESKLEERLKNLIVILKEEAKSFDKPEEKQAYQYWTVSTNSNFYEFIRYVYNILNGDREKVELKIKIVDEILKFMTTSLRPIQLPYSYILMKMYKDSLDSKTLEEWSTKFVENLKHIIKEFGSEVILRTAAEAFKTFTDARSWLIAGISERDRVFDIVESTMKVDRHLGSIFGILVRYQFNRYSEKYDLLIKTWREMDDVSVHALLNELHNEDVCFSYLRRKRTTVNKIKKICV